MTVQAETFSFLVDQLSDPLTHWNMGTFGAIAEFMRDPDEPVHLRETEDRVSAVTGRGGICVRHEPDLRLVAYESTTRESWNQGIALCLSAENCAMSRRKVLTELGADRRALREENRSAVLFDLGLDVAQVDVCVRASDKELIAMLRDGVGRSIFAHDNLAMGAILAFSPHRVFVTRLGRVEVYQGIPAGNGKSPNGPHTHVLPKLLQHKRTHAATEPIPEGWVPCAHLYPSHPVKDGSGTSRPFDARSHRAFQAMLNSFGNPQSNALKQQVLTAIEASKGPSNIAPQSDRFARTTIRVMLRQLAALNNDVPALPAWFAAYDRSAEVTEEAGEPL